MFGVLVNSYLQTVADLQNHIVPFERLYPSVVPTKKISNGNLQLYDLKVWQRKGDARGTRLSQDQTNDPEVNKVLDLFEERGVKVPRESIHVYRTSDGTIKLDNILPPSINIEGRVFCRYLWQ